MVVDDKNETMHINNDVCGQAKLKQYKYLDHDSCSQLKSQVAANPERANKSRKSPYKNNIKHKAHIFLFACVSKHLFYSVT